MKPSGQHGKRGKVDKVAERLTDGLLHLKDLISFFNYKVHYEYQLKEKNCHVFSSAIWISLFGEVSYENLVLHWAPLDSISMNPFTEMKTQNSQKDTYLGF